MVKEFYLSTKREKIVKQDLIFRHLDKWTQSSCFREFLKGLLKIFPTSTLQFTSIMSRQVDKLLQFRIIYTVINIEW